MTMTVDALVAAARGRIRELSPAGYRAWTGHEHVLIDVREPAEYAAGHLPGAVNLPRGVLEFQIHAHPAMACVADSALSLRDRPLVLYCLSGGRSGQAFTWLKSAGHPVEAHMGGGISAWRREGLPVTRG